MHEYVEALHQTTEDKVAPPYVGEYHFPVHRIARVTPETPG